MAENRNETAAGMVFPRSLMIAAKTFADRPKVVLGKSVTGRRDARLFGKTNERKKTWQLR